VVRSNLNQFFFFLHQDTAAVWASEGEPLPGHRPPLWAASVLTRALLQTTGWKDFKSACGVGPLQDSPLEPPGRVQCLAVYSAATNNCKDSLLSPWGTSAGSVRLLRLLTFQWSYSLKPPGASPGTLPCHPSAVSCITWDGVPPCPAVFYPCILSHPSSVGQLRQHSPQTGPRVAMLASRSHTSV